MTALMTAERPAGTARTEIRNDLNRAVASRGLRLIRATVLWLSVLNLVAVVTLLVLLRIVSEAWWASLVLTYLPRVPYLVPSLLVCAAVLFVRRRMLWVNLLAVFLVAGPIMGGRVPRTLLLATEAAEGTTLTMLSCNVQGWHGDPQKLRAEFQRVAPDVIVLQEAPRGFGPLAEDYADWNVARFSEYVVASKYPLEILGSCPIQAAGRHTAMLCRIEGPEGPFLVCNTHLTTIRYGLSQLKIDSLVSGTGIEELMAAQDRRASESRQTRDFASGGGFDLPLLALGDFNTPTTTRDFQEHWGDLTSAFDVAGWGWGYTSPCNTGRHWPSNTPWLRIDHILCSGDWQVERCWIGASDGSDHRFIAARVRLK